jgi:hypothetical protein
MRVVIIGCDPQESVSLVEAHGFSIFGGNVSSRISPQPTSWAFSNGTVEDGSKTETLFRMAETLLIDQLKTVWRMPTGGLSEPMQKGTFGIHPFYWSGQQDFNLRPPKRTRGAFHT